MELIAVSPGEPQAGTKGVQAAWLCAACMACAVGHRLQARVCLVKEWWREGDTLWRDQEFSRHGLASTGSTPSCSVRHLFPTAVLYWRTRVGAEVLGHPTSIQAGDALSFSKPFPAPKHPHPPGPGRDLRRGWGQ